MESRGDREFRRAGAGGSCAAESVAGVTGGGRCSCLRRSTLGFRTSRDGAIAGGAVGGAFRAADAWALVLNLCRRSRNSPSSSGAGARCGASGYARGAGCGAAACASEACDDRDGPARLSAAAVVAACEQVAAVFAGAAAESVSAGASDAADVVAVCEASARGAFAGAGEPDGSGSGDVLGAGAVPPERGGVCAAAGAGVCADAREVGAAGCAGGDRRGGDDAVRAAADSAAATACDCDRAAGGEEVDPVHFRVQADTDSITVREVPVAETPSPCFACGWCVDVCPTALNPVNLLDLAEHAQHAAGGTESAAIAALLRSHEAREALHCVGCGLCSYVCPTRLPLTQQTLRLRTWVVGAEKPR